jgi:H+/Cl- antiporter ClcA
MSSIPARSARPVKQMNLAPLLPKKLFSSTRWHTRAVVWLAAALAGLVAVGFAELSDLALRGFNAMIRDRLWVPFILTPAIGMLVVWATRRFFPGAQGSGVPQTIAATRLLKHLPSVPGMLSLRIACGKLGLGALALLGGFSAGREGPSVQIAASIMQYAHRLLPNARTIRAADMALAGGAAGIAAAFNTPLAGITFAIEELVSCSVNNWHMSCIAFRYLSMGRYRHADGTAES